MLHSKYPDIGKKHRPFFQADRNVGLVCASSKRALNVVAFQSEISPLCHDGTNHHRALRNSPFGVMSSTSCVGFTLNRFCHPANGSIFNDDTSTPRLFRFGSTNLPHMFYLKAAAVSGSQSAIAGNKTTAIIKIICAKTNGITPA